MRPPPFPAIALCAALSLIGLECRDSGPHRDAARAADTDDPRVRLRLSGHLEGRLEPCGCASGQIGGLARRSFLLRQDRDYDVLIEGGNLTLEGSALDELKLMTMLTVLADAKVPYHAVGLGALDLRMAPDTLGSFFGGFGIPTLASDLVVDGDAVADDVAPWPALPFVEQRVDAGGGATVRIASFALCTPLGEGAQRYGFELLEPEAAWRRAMDGSAPQTLRVLLVHASNRRARDFAALSPRPDLLVAINQDSPEPPNGAEDVDGVPLVNPGTRGRFVLDVTLTRVDGRPRVTRYRPIALQGSKTAKGAMEDRNVRELILAHRHEVAQNGIREALAERFPTPNGARYVGSEACEECHEEAYDKWAGTTHATAWDTLEEAVEGKYGWPVTHYPDCVTCHTVGYMQKSGFVNPDKTIGLAGVGCEACHGPGSAHVEAPEQHRLGPVPDRKCQECHDFEQTPDFDYDARWKQIEHR